jgi:DNA-binding NtrC family response regulator
MGYRCHEPENRADQYDFRTMELVMVKKQQVDERPIHTALTIDNQLETLRFVQENMNVFVTNCIRVKKMEATTRKKLDESARLFERNLEPLFTVISATSTKHVLDKLSTALKKALLLMAMEKFNCNKDSVCQALGLTRERLEREIVSCGLVNNHKAA